MANGASRRIAVGLVGLAASAAFVTLAFRHLDTAVLLSTWRTAHPLPWVPLAVLAYLAGHLVRGQRLRVLVRRETMLMLPTASNIVVIGYASNNVFPARLGEFVRAGMLAERTGMPLTQSLTITFIERLLDGVAILLLLLAGTWMLVMRPPWVWDVARVGSIVFGLALSALLVSVLLPSFVVATASRLSAPLGTKWRDRLVAVATSIAAAGACLRRPHDAAATAAYSVAVWLLEATMFLCILPVFGLKLQLAPALTAMSITNLGILVPSSPGFIGSFHFFCSQALIAQGVPQATALGYALLVHLTFYVPVTLWGAGAMLWYGVQVGATAAMARAAKSSPRAATVHGVPVHVIAALDSDRPPRAAADFDLALAEALVTGERIGIDHATLSHVATFLAEELDSLPSRLRFMYEAGMSAFRLYVRLRYLRSFCRLSVQRRRDAVHAWAFGRIGLLRQLFRPVRSTALLAYYECQAAIPQSRIERGRALNLVSNG